MKFHIHLVDLQSLRPSLQSWEKWKLGRWISASRQPSTLSFLAVPAGEIELTVSVPGTKGELAARGTDLQFFTCSSALLRKRAVPWGREEWCQSIFLKSLFCCRKHDQMLLGLVIVSGKAVPCPSPWESCGSDGSVPLCPGCHPSCHSCAGPGAARCLRCQAPEDVLQPYLPLQGALHGLCLPHCPSQFHVDSTGVCRGEKGCSEPWGFGCLGGACTVFDLYMPGALCLPHDCRECLYSNFQNGIPWYFWGKM